ncbi:DNA repair helicase putative [Entamoeba histolytica]|uniref:DNA repair helicase, putative n=4 Tax=Entamoeba histolytica TaxID=5759 RepID=C4M8K7_ENTH1|nr:DNA repair helicase, putative [Entamoeba histolytica HM-1:IMSS]EAL45446.1 DNA repair helicase, putative [Entamoeba histolytica HM-1:IMSS]ENY65243.1 DNA repair helicase rad3/xp-D, putative [Entamoeba histolytica HM-1:IMSS-A]GAT97944.1 DNA repair helicase putative [Entamoeba histolytica]|eukprot:XP_650832.1 DNA repair helicase, putative [Entamoeba histolytica HM-1:IMSS]
MEVINEKEQQSIIFTVNGIEIHFPYQFIYPEQYQFIKTVTSGVTNNKKPPHKQIIIEMGTGTGKTVSIITAAKGLLDNQGSNISHTIYCTRTIDEIKQIFNELTKLSIPSVVLASRAHLCLLDDVRESKHSQLKCQEKRDKGLCPYYHDIEDEIPIVAGIDELVQFGKQHQRCPYFCSRNNFYKSPFIVCTYNYILDPKVENVTVGKMSDLHQTLLVFDEAHNVDNVVVDAQTLTLSLDTLELATISLVRLTKLLSIEESKKPLKNEYKRLVEGLRHSEPTKRIEEENNIPIDTTTSIQFVVLMNDIVNFFREKLREAHIHKKQHINEHCSIPIKNIVDSFCNSLALTPEIVSLIPLRLHLLIKALGDEYGGRQDVKGDSFYYDDLYLVADFAALLCSCQEGFSYVPDVVKMDKDNCFHSVLNLICVDAAHAIQPILNKFHSIIFTSGTLSPLKTYINILGLNNVVEEKQITSSFSSMRRICPLFVTKGFDSISITSQSSDTPGTEIKQDRILFSSQYAYRTNRLIIHSYGRLILELSKTVPDGILCFFPSYSYMNICISYWDEMKIIESIYSNKLIFVESNDSEETSLAFQNYRLACHTGKGAILFCVTRGRLSEGINFTNHLARAVLIIGAPYLQSEILTIKERIEYLDNKKIISKDEYLIFDAMRTCNQCVGRCIRGKNDYAVAIYADKRYKFNDNKIISSMPQWIVDALEKRFTDISADQSITLAKEFLMKMSYLFNNQTNLKLQKGKTIWTLEDIHKDQLVSFNE